MTMNDKKVMVELAKEQIREFMEYILCQKEKEYTFAWLI